LVACNLGSPASLRAVLVGGACLEEQKGREARHLGWPVLQTYGMTEAASQVATAPLSALNCDFEAAPLPVLPIWEHRVGEDGCLQLRGEALFDSYV
ncbi:MAG: o-succinylbenzoate--CoA ligase, partial [Akkermansiaceae bacterium]|nr:o-succinylbenzoate--CoA ligase [Akkermansiaceae bacterium]